MRANLLRRFLTLRSSRSASESSPSHPSRNLWFSPRGRGKPAGRRHLFLEALEDRTLLSFAAPVAFDLGAAPNGVAVGHFEGAAAPLDVVTANANGTVSVLLGKGDGTLQNPISITVGGTPDAVAVGDFLGNGLQDIAVANANGTVTVLLSNGNGTFQAPKTFSVGATPVAIAVGDFNSDSKLDIVTANSNGTVTVVPGKGDGTFGAGLTSTAGGILTSVAVGDFNHDGKPDLVVGNNTGLDILLGNGNGTFQLKQTVTFSRTIMGFTFVSPVSSVAVSDLRSNGKEDVVAASSQGVDVLLGNGDGTVQSPTLAGGQAGVASFVVGDFNGDGKPDIVTSNAAGYQTPPSLSFLAGKGDGTFQAATTVALGETANSLAVGDFRGAGKLDLALATSQSGNTVGLLLGNGNGTFATTPTITGPVDPLSIAVGDFNGDGKPDLVTSGANISVLLNNGNGTFRAGPVLPVQGFAGPVVVGDFTGNGKQDIAVAEANTIEVFLGNGNGTFQTAKVITLSINELIQSMVVGNFVKGGLPDLIISVIFESGTAASGVQVLLNKGNGNFALGQTVPFSSDIEGLAAADFNGDGKLDLVTTTMLPDGTRDVAALLGNGNGTFQAPILTPTGFSPFFVSTGDFNGDGKADLVLVDYFDVDERVLVMKGNGNGTFQKPLVLKFDIPLGFTAPAVGDFFGDGKLSFAVPTGQGYVSVLRGNGDGTFQAPVNYLIGAGDNQPSGLVAADFNGDGKPDLAASSFLGTVSVLLNTSPKPATGTVATMTTLAADNTTVVTGQPVTLTATVTATAGTATATGTVTFFDGTQMLGEVALDPNGQARLLVAFHPGSHSLHASFAGIEPFTASTSAGLSETVNKDATTTTLTVNLNAFGVGGLVILSATVVPAAPGAGVPTGTVTFFDGTTVLGTVQLVGGQATLYLGRRLAPGKHTITVSYSGDTDFLASISAPFNFTI
jgi:hypothetical protein